MFSAQSQGERRKNIPIPTDADVIVLDGDNSSDASTPETEDTSTEGPVALMYPSAACTEKTVELEVTAAPSRRYKKRKIDGSVVEQIDIVTGQVLRRSRSLCRLRLSRYASVRRIASAF